MIHSGLEALQGHWDKEEYAAGYRARFSAIPDSEEAHPCWRTGWEDADTKLLESARHSRIVQEGRGRRVPGHVGAALRCRWRCPCEWPPLRRRTHITLEEVWIDTDVNLGVHGLETL
jgi:hypothetical protein